MTAAPRVPRESEVWEQLAQVKDPELPVSIVDLGLVYEVRVSSTGISVDLTFTSMGCPCTDWIIEDVGARLRPLAPGGVVDVTVVWDPPWTRDRISPTARLALAQLGVRT